MNTKEILEILKSEKQYLNKNFGVEQIALFGSYSKENQKKDSDIDLYVEFKEINFSYLMGLYVYLEKKFDSKIDIIRKGPHLSERFMNHIKNDLIYVG